MEGRKGVDEAPRGAWVVVGAPALLCYLEAL